MTPTDADAVVGRAIRGVVFDKDGTLLDFHATWDGAVAAAFDGIENAEARLAAADALRFDLADRRILADSEFIAGTYDDMVRLLSPHTDVEGFSARMIAAAESQLVAMDGADAVLRELADRGIPMSVATNDSAAPASDQMAHLGWSGHFVAVIGADSGHGAKPSPGMVHAAAAACDLDASEIAMVGDSSHDLIAARAAGALAVMIGDQPTAIPHADIRISHLSELLTLL